MTSPPAPRPSSKEQLLLAMLGTLAVLSNDATARIDARLWFKHYKRKIKQLGIQIPKT